jgi:hypothetical protein
MVSLTDKALYKFRDNISCALYNKIHVDGISSDLVCLCELWITMGVNKNNIFEIWGIAG